MHKLKCWRGHFDEIVRGLKRFELRRDDRHYSIGDVLHLSEYDPDRDRYTGRECWVQVTSILTPPNAPDGGLGDEHVIMSIELREPV